MNNDNKYLNCYWYDSKYFLDGDYFFCTCLLFDDVDVWIEEDCINCKNYKNMEEEND